jgi:hypothetical protein
MAPRGPTRLVSLVAALAGTSACIQFEPGSDRLSDETRTLEDGEANDAEPGRDWSCIAPAGAQPESGLLFDEPDRSQRLVASIRLLELSSSAVIPGVKVRACEQRDTTCMNPVTDYVTVDAEGWVDIVLYEGFSGYFEAITDSGITMPGLIFLSAPLTGGSRVEQQPFAVVARQVLDGLGAVIGSLPTPDTGTVWVRAFDCRGASGLGVSFNIDRPGGPSWYFIGELPSSTAQATAESGLGGFANVPVGSRVVDAAIEGRSLAGSKSLLVRGGWVSGVRILPTGM